MDEAEGTETAATDAATARAVQAGAGGAEADAAACLNCGALLVGEYCHDCGQAGHIHRTLGALWHDLLHGVLHFEGKIWRTLPLLAWRPGVLTRRYIDGERARFVSPLALFLFSVFLMFAVVSMVGGPAFTTADGSETSAAQDVEAGRSEVQARLDRLQAERDQAAAERRDMTKIDADIRLARRELDLIATLSGQAAKNGFSGEVRGLGWLDAAFRKARENPSLLFYKLQSNAYKFSWALIPISIPFLWLLFFWKRRYKAYDHAVFVTYSIAFMTLLTVVLALGRAAKLSSGLLVATLMFVPPIHMHRQLRGAYDLSFTGALWRTIFLLVFAFVAAGLYFTILLALGVLG